MLDSLQSWKNRIKMFCIFKLKFLILLSKVMKEWPNSTCHARISPSMPSPVPIPPLAGLAGCQSVLSWPVEQKNGDRTGALAPGAEIKQENRVKIFLSQEANMKWLLEKEDRALRAENSTGVISDIKSQLFWYNLSGIKYSLGWPAMFPWERIWDIAADSHCVFEKVQRENIWTFPLRGTSEEWFGCSYTTAPRPDHGSANISSAILKEFSLPPVFVVIQGQEFY